MDFDPGKDAANIAKHGVSLSVGVSMDMGVAIVREDRSQAYGEQRFTALGPVGDTIMMMAFTYRDDQLRIISIRRASPRERRYFRDNHG